MLLLRVPEHIPQRHLESFQHRIQTAERDRLIALLQSKERGGREAGELGELSERHLAAGLLQELGELLVEV